MGDLGQEKEMPSKMILYELPLLEKWRGLWEWVTWLRPHWKGRAGVRGLCVVVCSWDFVLVIPNM